MATWTDDVSLLTDGAEASAAVLNRPLQALAARTDYLKQAYEAITDKSRVVIYRVAASTATVAGDLVYYNSDCGYYDKAQALWGPEYAARGEMLAADQARVKGVVLLKHAPALADILISGLCEDAAVAAAMMGAAAPAGIYYLSAAAAGKATATPPPLQVPVAVNTGAAGFIFNTPQIYQPNHMHRSLQLRGSWLAAMATEFDDMDKPAWATMGYDIAGDPDFAEWFAAYPGELTVVADGLVQRPGLYMTGLDNLWYMGTYAGSSSSSSSTGSTSSTSGNSSSSSSTSVNSSSSSSPSSSSPSSSSTSDGYSSSSEGDYPNGATIVVYSYSPMIAGEPVMRALDTDTPCELAISSLNGVANVSMVPLESDITVPTGYSVVNMIDRHLKLAPVVSSITSSGGLTIVKGANGLYTISTGDSIEGLLDAELVNMNNTVEVTDDPYFYYNFPANRAAALLGKVPVPRLNSVNTYAVAAWVYRRGVIGATAGSPVTFPAITAEITYVGSPRHSSPAAIPAAPGVATTIAAQAGSVQTNLYYGETPAADRLTVGPEGTVYVKLSMPQDTYNKYITRFGIIIYLVAGSGPVVVPCGT